MFGHLRDLLADEVDLVKAFRELPPLPEASRMTHHLRIPGDPNRHRKITPRLILESVRYKFHLLRGGDDEHP